MSGEDEHGRYCAGCQILGLRTAIEEVLDGGFVISETARRILATAVGRRLSGEIIDLDDLSRNSSGPFADLFTETGPITGAKPGIVVHRKEEVDE